MPRAMLPYAASPTTRVTAPAPTGGFANVPRRFAFPSGTGSTTSSLAGVASPRRRLATRRPTPRRTSRTPNTNWPTVGTPFQPKGIMPREHTLGGYGLENHDEPDAEGP